MKNVLQWKMYYLIKRYILDLKNFMISNLKCINIFQKVFLILKKIYRTIEDIF